MDPLIQILPEIHENVIQHFNAVDFKNLTEVSPNWNETLENNQKMMGKVKLKLDQPVPAICRLWKIIENSDEFTSRHYQKAYIGSHLSSSKYSDKILKYFLNTGQTLLNLAIGLLVELSAENARFFGELDLSNLKFLHLTFVTKELTTLLLTRCSSLINLYLIGNPLEITSIPSLRSFLERNQNLKRLLLCREYHKAFFNEDISDIAGFQLKYIQTWNTEGSSANSVRIERNFIKFLGRQSLSLERIDMHAGRSKLLKHMFNKMPALKYLKIRMKFKTENLQLNVNENIVELFIPSFETPEEIERIIAFVPNLTKLQISTLTLGNIETIGRHLPALQELLFFHSRKEVNIDGPNWTSLWPNAVPVCRLVPYE